MQVGSVNLLKPIASFIRVAQARVEGLTCVDHTGSQLSVLPSRPRHVALKATGVQANLFSRFFRVIRSYANSVGKVCPVAELTIPIQLVASPDG